MPGSEDSTNVFKVNKNTEEDDSVEDEVVTIIETEKTTQQSAVRKEIERRQLTVQSSKEDVLEGITTVQDSTSKKTIF